MAVGWSGYASGLLTGWGVDLPQMIPLGEVAGYALHINPLAIFIIFVVAGLLILGTRESAWVNSALVVLKIAALILFLVDRAAGVRHRALHAVRAVRLGIDADVRRAPTSASWPARP